MVDISPPRTQFTKIEKLSSHDGSTGLGVMHIGKMSSPFETSTADERMTDNYSETSSHSTVFDRCKHERQTAHDGRINQTEAENKTLHKV